MRVPCRGGMRSLRRFLWRSPSSRSSPLLPTKGAASWFNSPAATISGVVKICFIPCGLPTNTMGVEPDMTVKVSPYCLLRLSIQPRGSAANCIFSSQAGVFGPAGNFILFLVSNMSLNRASHELWWLFLTLTLTEHRHLHTTSWVTHETFKLWLLWLFSGQR